jgi:general secretion pathway protein J
MTMAHREPPRDQGFTLVETLASLVVLGLLSLMILAGLGGRYAAFARTDRQTAADETVEAVQALLRDRLAHAWPATVYNVVPPGPDFAGAADQVTFLAPPPLQKSPGALRRYQLSLQTGGELVLQSRSDLALDRDHWADRQVIMSGVQSLDLAYFGAALKGNGGSGGAGPPAWRPDWREQALMPSLVRVRIAFPEADRRRWPDLMIHPMADIDASCVLNLQTSRCRGR